MTKHQHGLREKGDHKPTTHLEIPFLGTFISFVPKESKIQINRMVCQILHNYYVVIMGFKT